MDITGKIQMFAMRIWQSFIVYGLGIFAVGMLLFFKLDGLVPAFSQPELDYVTKNSSLESIIDQPIYAPHALVQHGLIKLGYGNVAAMRAVSAIFALLGATMFYYVVKRWYSARVALLSLAMFASSAWYLHFARLATPHIFRVFVVLAVFAFGTWARQTRSRNLMMVLGSLIMASLFYVSGFAVLAIAILAWQRKSLAIYVRESSSFALIIAGLILVGSLVPLGLAVIQDVNYLKVIAGLPETVPSVGQVLKKLLDIPVQLAVKGPSNPVLWLGRVPLVDIFTLGMAFLGAYAYYFKKKLDRTKLLFAGGIFSFVLAAIGDVVTPDVLIPIIYILAAAGIGLMLQQWSTVFPRNPLARSIGTSLVSIAVILAVFYSVNHYFIAWPNAPETKAVFQLRP